MAYQYRKFINFFASLPTQVVIKVYQYTCFIVFWVYIWRYNDVMNDTVILFFGLYLLLNFFLFLMQYNRAIVRPVQSQDLVAVLVISMAQVVQIIYNIVLICFLFTATYKHVFSPLRLVDPFKPQERFGTTPEVRDSIKLDFYYCLGFDLPHHLLWIAYLLMRFKPDRWGGDVIIAPGYDEIQQEEKEHGPFGAMVDKVLSDKDK